MQSFTPNASWNSALKYAGLADGRQVRQFQAGNHITRAKCKLLALLGGKSYTSDGKPTTYKGLIKSKAFQTLTPEIYDTEAAPRVFKQTADTASTAQGASVALLVNTTAGIIVHQVIYKVDQRVQARVTAVDSATQITVTLIKTPGAAAIVLTAGDIAQWEKHGTANIGGPTVGDGANREMILRSNNLQFSLSPMAQDFQNKFLRHYTVNGTEKTDSFKDELEMNMREMQLGREGDLIGGIKATEGSGSTRRYYADGMENLAGTVFENQDANGALSWDDLTQIAMPTAMRAGTGDTIYALCGWRAMNVFSSYVERKMRITDMTTESFAVNVNEIEINGKRLRLIGSDYMDSEAREGQMISFVPDLLTRGYLEGLDLSFLPKLDVGNVLVERSAWAVCEGLIVSNPEAITVWSNILRGA
jgi:hypothetical protein